MSKSPSVVTKSQPNYYLALDIIPGASQNEIHHAYKRAKMTYTQDSLAAYSLIEEENNDQIMKEIEDAYEILGHPSKRREYDIKMGFNTWNDKEEAIQAFKVEMSRPSIASSDKGDQAPENPFGDINYTGDSHMENHMNSVDMSPSGSRSNGMSAHASNSHVPNTHAVNSHINASVKATNVTSGPKIRVLPSVSVGDDEMHFEANPEFEEKIRNCDSIDGAFIRAVRVYRQMSVEQLANCTKLAASRIRAVEEEDTSDCPLPVYVRGHVAIICNVLSIPNSEELAMTYVNRLKEDGKLPKPSI